MSRLLFLVIGLLVANSAAAHAMRVFARVDAQQVSGYAFFVGGGRPAAVDWVARMGKDTVARGKTGADGSYSLTVPSPVTDDIVITVDTREGHVASARVAAARFDAAAASAVAAPTENVRESAPAQPGATAASDAELRQLIEVATERQIGPLLERIEEMDARMRLTDVMSGIFLIIGLAGMGLWARDRKRH